MISNPYLAFFFSLPTRCMRDPTVPLQDDLESALPGWLDFKFSIATHYSWAVPTQSAIDAVGKYASQIVEIGAGSGYWAWLFSQAGIEVFAYDRDPHPCPWHLVRYGDESSVVEHSDATLLLCWPPAGTDMALKALYNYSGEYVIYVGEWMRGNADKEFFEVLGSAFQEIERVSIPQWFMRTDRLSIHQRVASGGLQPIQPVTLSRDNG